MDWKHTVHILYIPTYRVYQLYDTVTGAFLKHNCTPLFLGIADI